MKNFLLWLFFSTCALAQTLPWTGNSTDAWLKQSPNALVLPKAGTYIKLSGQTNRLSISSDQLLLDGNPIGGTTIYTGDGTLPSDRFVDGDGHLMSFFGNDLFLAESASGSTLQGGTNLIAIAPSGIEFRTPGLPTANNGDILTLSGGLVDYAAPPSALNFANTDLTFTGDRLHEASGSGLSITNLGYLNLSSLGSVRISTGSGSYGNPGQVLTSDGTNADWQDNSASQNFANTDLTFDATRTHDGAGFDLTIQNIASMTFQADYAQIAATNDVYLVAGVGPYNYLEATAGVGVTISAPEGFTINAPTDGDPGQVLTSDGSLATWQNPSFPLNGVPTVAAGSGAGGSPTIALANETDSAFTLNITAGTSPATDDDIAVITFSVAYATAPHYSLSSGNKPTATLSGASQVWATTTTTNLTLHSNSTGLTATTNYVWEIIVVR